MQRSGDTARARVRVTQLLAAYLLLSTPPGLGRPASAADDCPPWLLTTSQGLWSTHRVEEHCEEELAPVDDLVQLTGAAWVLVVEDRVCEEAAGLPREDLRMGRERGAMASPGTDGDEQGHQKGDLRKAASCVTTQPPNPWGSSPPKNCSL